MDEDYDDCRDFEDEDYDINNDEDDWFMSYWEMNQD